MNKEVEILSAEHNSKLVDDLRIELTKIDESSKYLSKKEISDKRRSEIFCYLYAIDNAYDSPFLSDISNLKKLKETGILSTIEFESKTNQINAAKANRRKDDILDGTFIIYIKSHIQQLVTDKLISEEEKTSAITQYLENIMANFKINKSLKYINSLKAAKIIADDEYVIIQKILMKKRKKKNTKITICSSIFIIIICVAIFIGNSGTTILFSARGSSSVTSYTENPMVLVEALNKSLLEKNSKLYFNFNGSPKYTNDGDFSFSAISNIDPKIILEISAKDLAGTDIDSIFIGCLAASNNDVSDSDEMYIHEGFQCLIKLLEQKLSRDEIKLISRDLTTQSSTPSATGSISNEYSTTNYTIEYFYLKTEGSLINTTGTITSNYIIEEK